MTNVTIIYGKANIFFVNDWRLIAALFTLQVLSYNSAIDMPFFEAAALNILNTIGAAAPPSRLL